MILQFNGNWSFSWLMKYESCAHLFRLGKIDKLPQLPQEPDNPLLRGSQIHDTYEKYVKGESDVFDERARCGEKFKEATDHLRYLYTHGMVKVEEDWLFDRNWDITDLRYRCKEHETPDENCEHCQHQVWLWAKLDACVVDVHGSHVIVIDYKTGKSQYKAIEHVQQLQLYAAIAAIKFPWAQKITAELWYLDEGHVRSAEHTHEDALKFIGRFDKRAQRIYEDRFFRPNPNKITCAYCPYGPRRGTGACQFGV